MPVKYKIIIGQIINPINDNNLTYFSKGILISQLKDRGYVIKELLEYDEKILEKYKKNSEIIDFKENLIIPGFIDLHFHWVQDDVCLKPKTSLLSWLQKYTWPFEKKFANNEYSIKKSQKFSKKLIKNGTLGGAIYGSIHPSTVINGFKEFKGDFFIGDVAMTINSPSYLTQKPKECLEQVKRLARKYGQRYVITPRFAYSTDPITMKAMAKIGKDYNCLFQTHLAETKFEILSILNYYKKHFKEFETINSYTEIYDRCNLLNKRTILGHCIHLDEKDWKLLSKRKSNIAHCPTSNAPLKQKGLGSGLFNFQKANKYGVNWGLASDIGGGPYLSMIDVICSFVNQNKKKNRKVSYTQALYRSTLANSKILQIDKKSGNFGKNKDLNFIVLKNNKVKFDSGEKILESIFKKYPRYKKDESIVKSFFKGREL